MKNQSTVPMPLIVITLLLAVVVTGPIEGCSSASIPQDPVTSESDSVMVVPAFPELSFRRPVDLTSAPGQAGYLYVVQQAGQINVFENRKDVARSTRVLDIDTRVNDSGNEEGLLGLAFHPNFQKNGYLYVNYTADNPRRTVVSRFSADPSNPTAPIDPGTEYQIIEIAQPYGNHNGGQVRFGPDGYLYIGMGDGGAGGDPQENGQNPATLLGAMLRIDVDRTSGNQHYAIPPDNPFVGRSDARAEIYAYGLRNPWRFSFDAPTGRLWAGDVGQNQYEEIDIIEKGGNYGWNTMEGLHCYDPKSGCNQDGLILPVVEYGRGYGASVTGGFVYRGSDVPALSGRYVYGDYVSGRIWALTDKGDGSFDTEQLFDLDISISSFGIDASDELYFLSFDGNIYRFASSSM